MCWLLMIYILKLKWLIALNVALGQVNFQAVVDIKQEKALAVIHY